MKSLSYNQTKKNKSKYSMIQGKDNEQEGKKEEEEENEVQDRGHQGHAIKIHSHLHRPFYWIVSFLFGFVLCLIFLTSVLQPCFSYGKYGKSNNDNIIISNIKNINRNKEIEEEVLKMKLITGASLPSRPIFFPTATATSNQNEDDDNDDDKNEKKAKVVNILEYGADPTGAQDSTMALQNAIDSLAPMISTPDQTNNDDNIVGGIVQIPSGRYLITPIQLRSYVYLSLEEDAVLMASANREDYVPKNTNNNSGNSNDNKRNIDQDPDTFPLPLIRCTSQTNTGILGSISSISNSINFKNASSKQGGVISGQASTHLFHHYNRSDDRIIPISWDGYGPSSSSENNSNKNNDYCPIGNECRSRLIELHNCTNVLIENVMLRDSMDWTLHLLGCTNVLVQGLIIRGDFSFPNNDGIDIASSTNITIRNNNIDTADDAICIKSTSTNGPVNNIRIVNNTVRSHSSAFKIGSSTQSNITNVLIDGLYVTHANRGLGIQHRDEGHVRNIFFKNVYMDVVAIHSLGWWGCGEPVWITSTPRHRPIDKGDDGGGDTSSANYGAIGTVSGIYFMNIVVRKSENTVLISSRGSDTPVSNVRFRDVTMRTGLGSGSGLSHLSGVHYKMPGFEYVPSYSPERLTCSVFGGEASCDAIHLENVWDVVVERTKIWWGEEKEDMMMTMSSASSPLSTTPWGECVGVSGQKSGAVLVSDVACHSGS